MRSFSKVKWVQPFFLVICKLGRAKQQVTRLWKKSVLRCEETIIFFRFVNDIVRRPDQFSVRKQKFYKRSWMSHELAQNMTFIIIIFIIIIIIFNLTWLFRFFVVFVFLINVFSKKKTKWFDQLIHSITVKWPDSTD